jgi:uncharacterized membrane protein
MTGEQVMDSPGIGFLVLAAFLCSLVAGFLVAFAVVVMPGIRNLADREFIRAFQVIDGVIQRNQPVFMVLWAGSVIALVVAAAFGFGQLDGSGKALLVAATLAYLCGVQLPTGMINIPLNNRLQSLDADAMDERALEKARAAFEPRWNRWNRIRTVVSCLVSLALILVVKNL